MTHIELIEPRLLFAANGLDQTFGTNGMVTLPGVTVGDAVVSVPGGYFVEAYKKGANYLYKLNDDGSLDTAFGDAGRISTPNFGIDQLAYDKKYDLLYAAGVTRRLTDGESDYYGNTATLRVQRFNGTTGDTDTSFADSGVASFEYGRSNTSVAHRIAVGELLPLAKRGLAVAFDHASHQTPGYAISSYDETSDIVLLNFTANGSRASAFGRRGIVNVTSGYDHYIDAQVGPTTHTLDKPYFGDLQLRSDGTLRLLASRRTGTSAYSNDDEGFFSASTKAYVQSFGFTGRGTPDASGAHTWQVGKTSPTDRVALESGEYQTLLVRADGDRNVTTVGTRYTGRQQYELTSVYQAVSLSPTRKPIYTTLRSLTPTGMYAVLPFARGYYAVDSRGGSDGGYVAAQKLKTTFARNPNYNGGVETFTDIDEIFAATVAVDIDGRLLALHGSDITRISG